MRWLTDPDASLEEARMHDVVAGRDPDPPAGARGPGVPVWDRPGSVLLHGLMVLGVGFIFLASRFGERQACLPSRGCTPWVMELGSWMLDWMPLLILLVSVVATVVLWRRGRQVFWVALVAIFAMIAVFVVASVLATG